MVTKRHGVIGGPRNNTIIRPRMKPGFFPNTSQYNVVVASHKNEVDTFVVTANGEETIHIPIEEEVLEVSVTSEELDPIEEEDKVFNFENELLSVNDSLTCNTCGFISKSERGLKSHKRWKHSIVNC